MKRKSLAVLAGFDALAVTAQFVGVRAVLGLDDRTDANRDDHVGHVDVGLLPDFGRRALCRREPPASLPRANHL